MLKPLGCKGFGGIFLSAIGKYMYHIVSYASVKYTDILKNARLGYYIIDYIPIEIRKMIDLWEGYLKLYLIVVTNYYFGD